MAANPERGADAPATPSDFVYADPFAHGEDATKYRLVTLGARPDGDLRRQAGPRRRAGGADGSRPRGDARRVVPSAPEAPAAGRGDPGGPGGFAERPLHGDGAPRERRRLREVRAAVLPGHGHGDGRRVEGPAGLDGRGRRGVSLEGNLEDLHGGEPPLLADRRAHDVRRGQHRQTTSRRRSTSTRRPGATTGSSSSRRAAAPRTRPISSRRRRRS